MKVNKNILNAVSLNNGAYYMTLKEGHDFPGYLGKYVPEIHCLCPRAAFNYACTGNPYDESEIEIGSQVYKMLKTIEYSTEAFSSSNPSRFRNKLEQKKALMKVADFVNSNGFI